MNTTTTMQPNDRG